MNDDQVDAFMRHPEECECRRCCFFREHKQRQADENELAAKHPQHHHHIDDIDELEHIETELAWEEIQ